MAVVSTKYSLVADVPQQVASGVKTFTVQNLGSYPVWLGGSGVTLDNGLSLPATAVPLTIQVALGAGEALYAVSEAGPADVRVLTTTLG